MLGRHIARQRQLRPFPLNGERSGFQPFKRKQPPPPPPPFSSGFKVLFGACFFIITLGLIIDGFQEQYYGNEPEKIEYVPWYPVPGEDDPE